MNGHCRTRRGLEEVYVYCFRAEIHALAGFTDITPHRIDECIKRIELLLATEVFIELDVQSFAVEIACEVQQVCFQQEFASAL